MADKKSDKNIARERAKQIEKMMEDKDTPEILKWFYAKRKILIIILIVIFVGIIGGAVLFGIRTFDHNNIAKVYLDAYKILREFDEKKITELEENDLGRIAGELKEVIQKSENMLFKSYEYRLANYYMGLISYSQQDYNSSVSYFEKAYKDKSYPFADIAYYNIGKAYEQRGIIFESEEDSDNQYEFLKKAINHYMNMDKEFPDSFLTIRAKYQSALIYEQMNNYKKAMETLNNIKQSNAFIATSETTSSFTPEEDNADVIAETRTFVENVNNALVRVEVMSKIDEVSSQDNEEKMNNTQE